MRNGNGIQRADFAAIAGWVRMGSSALDLGCGDGSLLKYLRESRRVEGYGVEIAAPHGHDAFLLDNPQYHGVVGAWFGRIAREVAGTPSTTAAAP